MRRIVALATLALVRSLVATPSALPGFATAKAKIQSTTSARVYASKVLEARPRKLAEEVAKLKREGFRGGVQELLSAKAGEALSLAIVFRTAKDAQRELSRSKVADVKHQGKAEVKQLSIPSIPGAFAFTASEAGSPGGAGNVLFAVGRCFVVVGDFLRSGTAQQAGAVPSEAGPVVYQQDKSLCG